MTASKKNTKSAKQKWENLQDLRKQGKWAIVKHTGYSSEDFELIGVFASKEDALEVLKKTKSPKKQLLSPLRRVKMKMKNADPRLAFPSAFGLGINGDPESDRF
jgi:hypothetical protein